MKTQPISDFAREVSALSGRRLSESGARRLESKGVVRPARDPWGRRLFGKDDIEAACRHLNQRATAA